VGSGKTLTAVVASYLYLKMYPNNKVIVISPSALLFNFINGMIQFGLDIGDSRYSYYTYDKYIRKPQLAKDSLLIIDEAHNFRTEIITHQNENEETGDLEIDITSNKRGYKIMEYGSKHAHKVLLLTGTAFVNSLYDIENLLSMVDNRPPVKREDFEKVITNADNIQDYFNYKISYYKTSPTSIYFPKMNEAHKQIIPIYMTDEEEAQYSEIKQMGKPDAESTKPNMFYNAELYANNMIGNGDNPKIKWVIDKIKSEPNQKFIVYSTLYSSGIKLILNDLDKEGIKYTTITGKQSSSSKEENKKYFNGYNFGNDNFFNMADVDEKSKKYVNDKYRILVITKAGAEGVDTINCQNVILLNSLWNDATSEQIIARAIRFKSHFGLPENQRFVNVYRLLLAKKSNKEIVEVLINPDFKKFCDLKNEMKEETKKNLELIRQEEGTYKPTVKELKELKNSKGEPYIPEKTEFKDGKKNTKIQISPDGWDTYKIKKTDTERETWRIKMYSEWFGKYGKEKKENNPLKKGLYTCTADILMYVMAKAKTENIDDFCKLLGNDISLFEKYQSAILPYIMMLEKRLKQNNPNAEISEEDIAKIYAKLFRKVEQTILDTNYIPILKTDRSKEEKLQEFYTNHILAKYIIDKSSITTNENKIAVLEPSAGDGALIRPILELKKDATIDMVELNRLNRDRLKELSKGQPALFLQDQPNFLKYQKSTRYDYIFMNPPFHLRKNENAGLLKETYDFDFVKRAFAFLKVGGELIAITSQHYKSEVEMVDWYDNTENKNVIIGKPEKHKFESSTKKKATINIVVIKIIKTGTKEDNDILNIEFYKNSTPDLGKQILNNDVPITDIIKPKEEKTEDEQKEKPVKNIIVKINKKESPILPEPKPPVSDEQLENAEEKIKKEMEKFKNIGKKLNAITYTDSGFVQTVGYIALIMKYERKCAIITKDIQALQIDNKFKSNKNKLFFNNAETLSKDLLDCIERKDELIAIPITLFFKEMKSTHANMLMYRPFKKTIERFEPHGQETIRNLYDSNVVFDKVLKEMFEVKMKPYLKQYTPIYITPEEVCPDKEGFQSIEGNFYEEGLTTKQKKEEGGGFCAIWSLFLLELAFLNPTKTTNEILTIAYKVLENQFKGRYLKNIIRGYVVEIEKLLNNYIQKIDNTKSFNFAFEYNKKQKDKNATKIYNETLNIVQNQLLHLLVSWNSKSSIRKEIEDKLTPIKNLKPLEDFLKTKSIDEINDMMRKLTNTEFQKSRTIQYMIDAIIYNIIEKFSPNLTKESIMNYFKNNITV
jgi:tRNA1(Val) A37 N6-methylase TrmN6